MTKKELKKLKATHYVNSCDYINESTKQKVCEWIEYCYNAKHPQNKDDIEQLFTLAYRYIDIDKLLPAVLDDAMKKGYWGNRFLNWGVSYGF